jgi:hypothetical protein
VKEAFNTAALLLVASLLSLLAAEIAFRFYAIGWNALSYSATQSVVRLGVSGLMKASDDPQIRWELKPDREQLFKLALVRTNSRGLHDVEYPFRKRSATYRIAVLGDSQSMASGVVLEDAYHSVLEERLNAASDGRRYEVINFAVGGYNPGQYVAVLQGKVPAYDPDLVLVGYTPGNDARGNFSRKSYVEKPVENGFFKSFLLDILARAYENWSGDGPSRHRNLSAPEARFVERAFSELKRVCDSAGVGLLIVYLERIERVDRPEVRGIAERLGIEFLDTTDDFRGIPLGETKIFRIDRHPNPMAHRIFAEAIEARLRATFLRTGSDAPPASQSP